MENKELKCICQPDVGRHLIACPHTTKPDTERLIGKYWRKAIEKLDGKSVVNVDEPSDGDLERMTEAYREKCNAFDALKAENLELRMELAEMKGKK